ncbi:MAG: HAMP domain-containing histidine kinase [Candidatus Obscuribacterales bacterium]|nr:HAMP domain-containing histidine kinase [Candidatus Obscuribacterales bacterium]
MSDTNALKNRSKYSVRLSLLQKLLLFILVPIGIEIVFLSGALWLFHQAEMEVKQEARLNTVSTLVEQLIHSLYGAGSDIITIATLGPDAGEESFRRYTSRATECLSSLANVTAGDPEERVLVEKLAQSCTSTLKILEQSHDAVLDGPHGLMFIKGHRLTRQIERLTRDTVERIAKLKEIEAARKGSLPFSKGRTKYRLQALLWIATLFNVALGISLAVFMTRSLTSRLSVMLENTSRVVSRQELLPLVGGSDELSQLDLSMHETAQQLKQGDARQKELEESRKQFVAMIGHDLKNPLHFIQLSLSALSQSHVNAASPEGQQSIAQCAEEIQRLVSLTNDLIWAAKADTESFELILEQTQVWTIFERSVRTVQSLADSRGVKLEVEPSDEEAFVDRDRMIQVFVNLLSNAIQASKSGAVVKLVARRENQTIFLDVVDQGSGIPEAALSRIFERFYRVTNANEGNREGAGLGLAICQSIVKAHAGEIAAYNLAEGGCLFRVTLPLEPVIAAIPATETSRT